MQNCSWFSGEVSYYCEKRNLISIFKKEKAMKKELQPAQPHISKYITKQVLTEALSKYVTN